MRSCWSMRSFRPLKPITATGTNFSLLRARLRDILVAITRTRTATATQPRTSAQPRTATHRHRHTDTRPHTYSHTHTHREPCNTRSTLVVQHARTRCRRHLGSHHQSGHHAVSHQTRPGLSSVRGPTPAATTRAVCCTCVGKGDRLVARRHTPTGPGYETHRSMRGSRRLYSMCLNCLYCDRRLRSGMYTARSSWTSLMSWGEIIVAAAPAVAVAAPAVANGFAAAVVAVANGFAAAGAAAVANGVRGRRSRGCCGRKRVRGRRCGGHGCKRVRGRRRRCRGRERVTGGGARGSRERVGRCWCRRRGEGVGSGRGGRSCGRKRVAAGSSSKWVGHHSRGQVLRVETANSTNVTVLTHRTATIHVSPIRLLRPGLGKELRLRNDCHGRLMWSN